MKQKPTITFRLKDDFYDKLDKFTEIVLQQGFDLFREEFANIDEFYLKALKEEKRDDSSFRRHSKAFYLIEAMYYKIFDNHNRDAFNKARNTVLILPDCMSLLGDKCKREKTEVGKKCARCVPNCDINKIMNIADKYGVKGYFSKRKLEEQLTKIKEMKPDLGVIGISCLLTLASGMRSAREAGVPSRGVFLNFVGCEHWAEKPFPTETAIDRVQAILEEKYGLPDKAS
jgi:hypothetical protein